MQPPSWQTNRQASARQAGCVFAVCNPFKEGTIMARKTAVAKKAGDADTYRITEGSHGLNSSMTHSQMLATLATKSALSASTAKLYLANGDDLQVSD
ncbi:MAG: hypothetical protein GX970_14015 [Phyllobacteriaceae bacterium]|nr:hypothetical protein [Phyllobacteriaceae bacterium]